MGSSRITKADLEEEIERLWSALERERAMSRALAQENERLVTSLLQASAHYEKLVSYVRTLRDWAAGTTQTEQHRHAGVTEQQQQCRKGSQS